MSYPYPVRSMVAGTPLYRPRWHGLAAPRIAGRAMRLMVKPAGRKYVSPGPLRMFWPSAMRGTYRAR